MVPRSSIEGPVNKAILHQQREESTMTYLSARLTILSTLLLLFPVVAGAATVQFLGLEASGTDLQVTLAWSETAEVTAPRLAVRDSKGAELAAFPIEASPGETLMAEIPGVLSAVVEGHRQFSLVVLEEQNKLAAPLPFRIRFICPTADACDFEVVPGLNLVDTIDLAPELAAAIDASKGEAVDLQALTERWPELRGSAYSYAFDLEHSGTLETSTAGCTCTWTSVTAAPSRACGAYALLREDELDTSSSAYAEVEVGMELRCQTIELQNRIAVSTPAGHIVISPPRLVPCAAPCVGTVAHGLTGETLVIAEASYAASAQSQVVIDWQIDGQTEMYERLHAAVSLADDDQIIDSTQLVPPLAFRRAPSSAQATAQAVASAQRLSVFGRSLALSSFHGLSLGASGYATCASRQAGHIDVTLFCSDKEIGLLSGDRP